MKRLLIAVLLTGAAALSAVAAPASSPAQRPDLVIVISIDQFRPDYLERFDPWFGDHGFRRFTERGAVFPEAHHTHGVTYTGPGHATIGSGRRPSEHGVVGNYWFDRTASFDQMQWQWYIDDNTLYDAPVKPPRRSGATRWIDQIRGGPRYCVLDSRTTVSAGRTPGMSPMPMAPPSLAEAWKAVWPQSRVLSVALKDRAAVLMGGRAADAAYWFDYNLPGFVSSTHYRWNADVVAFNSAVTGYIPGSRQWTLSVPADEIRRATFDPPAAWPLKNTRYRGTFPHPIDDARALVYSAYGNDLLLDFALHVIATESLGGRGNPDVLFVGLSSTDYYGHYYGPDSMEVADGMIRLDRALARFLEAVERRLGSKVTVAVTSDHGVQANPEIARLRNPRLDAGRVDLRNPVVNAQTIGELPPLRVEIERRLAAALRSRFSTDASLSDAFIAFFEEPGLYINWQRVRALRLDNERVKTALRDVVRKLPGVMRAWTSTELREPVASPSHLDRLMRASFRGDRSPDVLMALRPNWIWTWGSNSTGHGQPVEADMHVPLMLWGSGINPGRYEMDASPADLAPTIGALAGVTAGGPGTTVLPCLK